MPWTVAERSRHIAEPAKGSRFMATISPVSSETEAKGFLADVAAEFPDASHHCWAWRLATPAIERAGDDGEPSGSAGRPILAQLTGRDVMDVAVVVSRWFGGTKLGVGGLARAYGGAAAEALALHATVRWQRTVEFSVVHEHAVSEAVERVLAALGAVTSDVEWATDVTRHVVVAESKADELWDQLADATRGRIVRPTGDADDPGS